MRSGPIGSLVPSGILALGVMGLLGLGVLLEGVAHGSALRIYSIAPPTSSLCFLFPLYRQTVTSFPLLPLLCFPCPMDSHPLEPKAEVETFCEENDGRSETREVGRGCWMSCWAWGYS